MWVSWSAMRCQCSPNQGQFHPPLCALYVFDDLCCLSPLSLSPRLFHRTVRERVDKFFEENNIVSLPLSRPALYSQDTLSLSLSSGPKDQLLDVPQILCLLSDCQPLLAGHGEGGQEGERKPFCCLAAQMVFGETVLVGVVMGAGWGFFAGLVAMTCTHDARYTPHTLTPSLTPSHTQSLCDHPQAVGVACSRQHSRLLPWSLSHCLDQSGG